MEPEIEIDEGELIVRCQHGDKQAYGILVQKYMKRAYYSALGLVASHESALDLSQEAFVRVYRSVDKLDPKRKFFTWYYRILRNLCLNYLRDRARHARPFSEVEDRQLIDISDESPGAEKAVEMEEMKRELQRAMVLLKPDEREIIILKEFREMSYQEISELLDCPIGTVMSRLYTARKALKSHLTRYLHE